MPEPVAAPGAVDVHAHLLPVAVLEALRAGRADLGVALHQTDGGEVLELAGGVFSRPVFPPMVEVADRLRWLDRAGVARQWVGPWLDTVGATLPAAQGAAWSRLLNTELAALCHRHPRLVPVATVPLQDGAAAARELEHAVERLGMRAVMIGSHLPAGHLGDAGRRPFFAAAAALGVPVFVHPVVYGPPRTAAPAARYLIEYPFATCAAFLDLLLGGVFTALPGLRLLLPHGGGTLLFQAGRIRHGLGVLPELAAVAPGALEQALAQCWFDLVVHSPAELELLRATVPVARLLLGSDAPFALGLADPVAHARRAFPDPVELDRVLAGNAAELLAG